jgi:GntR family transcriptional regulator
MRRERLQDDRPFMIEEASLPAALFPRLLERTGIEHNVVALAQEYGILLGKAEERISIEAAPAAIADTLRVAPSAPLMLLDRLLLTLDGQPVEWRIAHCHLGAGFYLAEMG